MDFRLNKSVKGSIELLARFLIAMIFIISGLSKFQDPEAINHLMASHGMPFVSELRVASAVLELVCGIALILGTYTRYIGLILFFWMIPATLIFHSYWTPDLTAMQMQGAKTHFYKNFAIMGGLLSLFINGAGLFSLDVWKVRRSAAV
ncbi:MAG: DoxX family protein [Burkholderiaceae bacterium]|jgi:putative oxidoreductase